VSEKSGSTFGLTPRRVAEASNTAEGIEPVLDRRVLPSGPTLAYEMYTWSDRLLVETGIELLVETVIEGSRT
jgi:hypothetical protein